MRGVKHPHFNVGIMSSWAMGLWNIEQTIRLSQLLTDPFTAQLSQRWLPIDHWYRVSKMSGEWSKMYRPSAVSGERKREHARWQTGWALGVIPDPRPSPQPHHTLPSAALQCPIIRDSSRPVGNRTLCQTHLSQNPSYRPLKVVSISVSWDLGQLWPDLASTGPVYPGAKGSQPEWSTLLVACN